MKRTGILMVPGASSLIALGALTATPAVAVDGDHGSFEEHVAEVFDSLDIDEDGALSADEVSGHMPEHVHADADENGDANLTQSELVTFKLAHAEAKHGTHGASLRGADCQGCEWPWYLRGVDLSYADLSGGMSSNPTLTSEGRLAAGRVNGHCDRHA